MSEWFYLWQQNPSGTWQFAGYFFGVRYQAQLLSGAMEYGWRITDSNNYEVYPPEAPTFAANPQLLPAQSLGVEQYGWTK